MLQLTYRQGSREGCDLGTKLASEGGAATSAPRTIHGSSNLLIRHKHEARTLNSALK